MACKTVKELKSVDTAGALTHYTDLGSVITIKSPLHFGPWERGLKLHPDEAFASSVGLSMVFLLLMKDYGSLLKSKNLPSTKTI